MHIQKIPQISIINAALVRVEYDIYPIPININEVGSLYYPRYPRSQRNEFFFLININISSFYTVSEQQERKLQSRIEKA